MVMSSSQSALFSPHQQTPYAPSTPFNASSSTMLTSQSQQPASSLAQPRPLWASSSNANVTSTIAGQGGGADAVQRRHYIPGFLSSTVGQASGFASVNDDEWNPTPSSRGPLGSGSPKSAFKASSGTTRDSPNRSPRGNLLGKSFAASVNRPRQVSEQSQMEEDAPPSFSLLDEDVSFSQPPLPSSLSILGGMNNNALGSLTMNQPERHTTQTPSVAITSPGYKVFVFGYPPSDHHTIIPLFCPSPSSLLLPPEPSPEGGNWTALTFKNEWEAQRAVRRNGEVIEGRVMVGVRWADSAVDSATRDSIATSPPTAQQNLSLLASNPSFSQQGDISFDQGGSVSLSHPRTSALRSTGRSLRTHSSSEIFQKPSTSSSTLHKTTSLMGVKDLFTSSTVPTKRAFEGADENERKREERRRTGEGGIVTKVSDFIFGW